MVKFAPFQSKCMLFQMQNWGEITGYVKMDIRAAMGLTLNFILKTFFNLVFVDKILL